MSEKLGWRKKRPEIIEISRDLRSEYRADFIKTMNDFGMMDTVVCEELGIEVTKGQEWRVEELIEKYGKG